MTLLHADLPPDPHAAELQEILRAAGQAAMLRFRRADVSSKPDGSAVTDADLAAQEIILERLARAFPGDALVSEEMGPPPKGLSGPTWFIDPIDGTSAFIEGLAHWGPTICRLDASGRVELGAFWIPRLQEFWFAAAGGGAWRNGDRLGPLPHDMSRPAPIYVPSHTHRVGPLPWPGKIRVLGCAAAHLAMVAAGAGAGTIITNWAIWDIGCGILLVREAGGAVVDLSGADLDPMGGPDVPFIAASPNAIEPMTRAVHAAVSHMTRP